MLRSASLIACLLLAACAQTGPGRAPISGCEPVGSARPVCGFQGPEDLVALPGAQALLVSEYGDSTGSLPGRLALLVLDTEERRVLYRAGDARGAPTPGWGDPACPGPPDVFSPHGIDLAPRPDGALALAVVQHGGRESIELFEVSGGGARWGVTWRGCLVPPEGSALNDVILLSDGGVLASHMGRRYAGAEPLEPDDLGFVLRWSPDAEVSKVAGSEVRLANGLEVSADEKTLYLNSSMGDGLSRIDLATGQLTGRADVPTLDNATWAPDGSLLVASLEPIENELFMDCLGMTSGACPIDFRIVAVDPGTLATRVLFDGRGSPMGAGTVGLQLGDELFVGSFAGDRILRVRLEAR